MPLAGTYDCVTQTPLGPQKGVLTIIVDDEASFTGHIAGDLGAMEIKAGRISGNTLSWQMKMTMPMPMNLDCIATIAGDKLTGTVRAGMFGAMELMGTRRS